MLDTKSDIQLAYYPFGVPQVDTHVATTLNRPVTTERKREHSCLMQLFHWTPSARYRQEQQ